MLDGDDRPSPPRSLLRALGEGIGKLILPPLCPLCRTHIDANHALCPICWAGITFVRAPYCDRLGIPLPFDSGEINISAAALANPPDFDRARLVALYTGTMRTLVHGMKYSDRHDSYHLFARWLTDAARPLIDENTIICPVPLSRGRLLHRRFNQAAELSRRLAHATNRPYLPQVLIRRRATLPQVGLSAAQRKDNVAGAFAVPARHRHRVLNKAVLLVDDVVTTGATVNACARALRRAGARRVDVVALAGASDTLGLPQ